MTNADRAIARRVRRVRFANELTQSGFATALNISLDRLASIEYERTPLPVDLADEICIGFDVNLAWLATGKGSMKPFIGRIEEIAPEIDASELLSKIFTPDIQGRLLERYYADFDYNQFGMDAILTGFGALPEGEKAEKFLIRFDEDLKRNFGLIPHAGKEKLLSLMVRMLAKFSKDWDHGRRDFPGWPDEDSGSFDLTHTTTPTKTESVKGEWIKLKKIIQTATRAEGAKSKLAEFLGVDLTQLSKWLTDSPSQREPGAEYTLQMQAWVADPKRQK